MTRKYKLERLQKHILLGFSGVTLASTIFFGGAQNTPDDQIGQDTYVIDIGKENNEEIKILNKALKENLKFIQTHNHALGLDLD